MNGFSIRNEDGIRYLAKKIARRRVTKQPFVIGAVGDGTLIGAFGNCETDGYLSVMERTLKPIFKAHGIELEVRKVIESHFKA